MTADQYIKRAVRDYELARKELSGTEANYQSVDYLAAMLVIAARLEALEDALIHGLPTAGEGV